MIDVHACRQEIRAAAAELGFDAFGLTTPTLDPVVVERYQRALEQGRHAGMTYLTRHLDKRLDPQQLVPNAKTVVCVAASYFQVGDETNDPGRIAMYSWGRDYHDVVRQRLGLLASAIDGIVGHATCQRLACDTAPILEKALAQQAGIGWIGRNGCLIHRRLGSMLVLGEIFIDIDLPIDTPETDHCGRCRRCLDACPTRALIEPYCVDANRCISYLTIEHRGDIDASLTQQFGDRLFGCDTCQQACPFQRLARPTRVPDFVDWRLGPRQNPYAVRDWSADEYKHITKDSAGSRASLAQWHRNAEIVIANIERRDAQA